MEEGDGVGSERGRRRRRWARKDGRHGQRQSVAVKELTCTREGKWKESPSDRAASASGLRAVWKGGGPRKTPEVLVSEPKESSDLTLARPSWKKKPTLPWASSISLSAVVIGIPRAAVR
jgi:hypothetical protein